MSIIQQELAPESRPSCKSPIQPGAALFVWAVWTGMVLLALAYVRKFSSRVPFFDDWSLVPVLTGSDPFTAAFLWEPFNEHRVPLPKLVLYILGRLTGFDFRAGMLLNILLLAGLSFAMIRTVGRMRGCLHFADAFLPLLVLSLAQWECFLIEYALNLVGSTVCAGAFLILLAGAGQQVTPRRAVRMGLCVVSMPLFGANGLVLVPALTFWLVLVGFLHCRTGDAAARRQGWLVLGTGGRRSIAERLYSFDLQTLEQIPLSLSHTLSRGLQVLGMLFGPAAIPGSALLKAVVIPLVILSGLGVWLAAWRRLPRERVVLLGWLTFFSAMGCLIAAIAQGRDNYLGQTPFVPRYATLLTPLGCAVYFIWARYGGVVAAGAMQMSLLLLAAVVFAPNLKAAFDDGRQRHRALRDFEADLVRGMPPVLLAERGAGRVFPMERRNDAAASICSLRDSQAAAFREVSEDYALETILLPASVISSSPTFLSGGAAQPISSDASVKITLPSACFVSAIRLHYAYANSFNSADYFEMSLQDEAGIISRAGRSKILFEAQRGEGDQTVTIWINERIDSIRLMPKIKTFTLRVGTVELLVPNGGK